MGIKCCYSISNKMKKEKASPPPTTTLSQDAMKLARTSSFLQDAELLEDTSGLDSMNAAGSFSFIFESRNYLLSPGNTPRFVSKNKKALDYFYSHKDRDNGEIELVEVDDFDVIRESRESSKNT